VKTKRFTDALLSKLRATEYEVAEEGGEEEEGEEETLVIIGPDISPLFCDL
jgi:hypothetical protein